MSVQVEKRRLGDWTVLAVSDANVRSWRFGRRLAFQGTKRAHALVLIRGPNVLAYDASGSVMTLEEVAALAPDIRDMLPDGSAD